MPLTNPENEGGAGPPLSDATPEPLGVAAAGTSPDASRADHVHVLPAIPALSSGTPLPLGVADAGVSPAASRADHVHALPTIPALSSATPNAQGTGAAGVAATASHSDHVHPFRSRYPVAVGTVQNISAGATLTTTMYQVLPRPGRITHIFCDSGVGLVTAGSYEIQPQTIVGFSTVTNYSAPGQILTMGPADTDTRKIVALASPIAVAAGVGIGFRCIGSATLAPATLDPRVVLFYEED